ncbi:hypothetical protein C900_03502 [Fulvivirga imtechensis AK7]|uniref:Uncharacterized protein n=1 Tax=Fulvivirga imtechensis AK7 TaxID=1237149 RepID=L8JTB5_9BACT|nr:hypothetical protein C900_03502 [Fulvivirga imtechensis AK7]
MINILPIGANFTRKSLTDKCTAWTKPEFKRVFEIEENNVRWI